MIRLFLEPDGLALRFGRVVPDAAAMLAALLFLEERLKAQPRAPWLLLTAVRFDASPEARGALARELSSLEPWSALAADAEVVAGAADLRAAVGGDDRVILLTASHHRFRQAAAAGVDAFHIGLNTPPEQRGVPFDEVPRIVEEALRIPTARPRSRIARTGGLVAIPTAGPADARARALAALLEDATVDWLTIGEDLILYTEQPDLEDRLSAEPGARHLSYAVHKHALVLEPAAADAGADALYEGHGWHLREAAGDEARRAPAAGWEAVRRRSMGRQDPLARPPRAVNRPADRYRSALRRFEPLLATVEEGDPLLAAVREIVGPAAAPDLLHHRQTPGAVTWTTPHGDDEVEDLIALIYDAEPTAAAAGAAALALTDSLNAAPPSAGVLHCLRLTPELSADEILAATLLTEERGRLLAAVELEGLSSVAPEQLLAQVAALVDGRQV